MHLASVLYYLFLIISVVQASINTIENDADNVPLDPVPATPTVATLENQILSRYPLVMLEQRYPRQVSSRVEAIGILGLLLFQCRKGGLNYLSRVMDMAMDKKNAHFNGLMNEPFLEFVANSKSHDKKRTVYEVLTKRKSGSVKSLLYQLMGRTTPPVNLSLELAVKVALMRTIGTDVYHAIQQRGTNSRKIKTKQSICISQVLFVPQLEGYIGAVCIKNFFEVTNLKEFRYVHEQFTYVSNGVAKLLLDGATPKLSHAHLQRMIYLPMLSDVKKQMLKDYQAVQAGNSSANLLLFEEALDRRKAIVDGIFVNEGEGITLLPLHMSSSVSDHTLHLRFTILEDGNVELHTYNKKQGILYLKRNGAFHFLNGSKRDARIGVEHRDLVIMSMNNHACNLILGVMKQMFKDDHIDNPLFWYFIRKYDLTVLMIEAPPGDD